MIEYGYDANSNRTQLKLDGTNYATYAYDNADRLSGITNIADSATVTYGYDNANRLISRSFPNGVLTSYEYDGMSRLKRQKDINATETLFDRQYGYNNANQIAGITEPTRNRTFGYDNLDRLTSVVDTTNGNESYAFDAVGNRTSSHSSSSYSYQEYNRTTATQTTTQGFDVNVNTVWKSEGSKR